LKTSAGTSQRRPTLAFFTAERDDRFGSYGERAWPCSRLHSKPNDNCDFNRTFSRVRKSATQWLLKGRHLCRTEFRQWAVIVICDLPASDRSLASGDFELDLDRFELRRNGQPRKVERKVFDLMAHFAKNPGHMFSRDDLISAVWANRVVSDTTVSTCIKSARKALGDSGDVQRFIETVRGRGFRFTTHVETVAPVLSSQSTVAGRCAHIGPALLVIPFRTLSQNPEMASQVDGLSTGVATVLTRIPAGQNRIDANTGQLFLLIKPRPICAAALAFKRDSANGSAARVGFSHLPVLGCMTLR
jgi:DNA-binding winged helix-turn-helix (wHTH) protein